MRIENKSAMKRFDRTRYGRMLAFIFLSAALIGFWFGADPSSKIILLVLSAAGFTSLFIWIEILRLVVSKVFRS